MIPIAPTSAQAGILRPGPGLYPFAFDLPAGFDAGWWDGPEPIDGQSLEDFLQQLLAGITGLDPTLVRPRWQAEPPNMPPFETDCWAAVGMMGTEPDPGWPWLGHDPTAGGRDHYLFHETVTVTATFYGDGGDRASGLWRDGLMVPQNWELLRAAGMGVLTVSGSTRTAEMIKNRWLNRCDRTVRIHRDLRRVYPVLNLKSASGRVVAQSPQNTIIENDFTAVDPTPT